MRILFASHSKKDPNGGASRVYHLLEQGLKERGHTVKALHYGDMGINPRLEKIVLKLSLPQSISRRVAREALQEYDVIMSSNGMLYPLFRRLKQTPHKAVLVNHLHGLNFFDNQATLNEARRGHMQVSRAFSRVTGPLTVRWDEDGSRFADLTIVQNGRDLDYLTEKNLAPLISIPLSVHPEILAAGVSAPAPESRNPASFLWFGSWVERKGRHYLPGAFEQIVKQHPSAVLTIGGTGMSAESLQQYFSENVRSRITVLPRISLPEQIEIYKRHAIFLFPSLSEGFGFALLEALSMGLAAVTTDTGLAGDFLSDRENAIIVPDSSALHLARGGMTLLENAELRCRIARNGQALAQTFTIERMISSYEEVFQHSLHERSAKAGAYKS